jgi:hypothetical protein
MKKNILRLKGLIHGLMDPHAATTLVFRLKTMFVEHMHALINKSVQRRAERSQSQANRP